MKDETAERTNNESTATSAVEVVVEVGGDGGGRGSGRVEENREGCEQCGTPAGDHTMSCPDRFHHNRGRFIEHRGCYLFSDSNKSFFNIFVIRTQQCFRIFSTKLGILYHLQKPITTYLPSNESFRIELSLRTIIVRIKKTKM